MNVLFCIKSIVVLLLLVTASITDIRTRTIPNSLILSGFVTGIITSAIGFSSAAAIDVLLGFLAGGGLLLVVSYISKGGIGMGDVKLLACVGLYLGLYNTIGVLVTAIIICGLFSSVLLITGRFTRTTAIPFAPFIFMGALMIFLFSL